jgi:uncharacterized protein (DUF934 family)
MPIIRNRSIAADTWTHLSDDEPLPRTGDVFVSLERFRALREEISRREGRTGVRVPGDTDPADLAPDLAHLPAIAIEIPRFGDGRAYTLARVIRDRHGYQGELRAKGGFVRDQLFYLSRVGFDTFEPPPSMDVVEALLAFSELTVRYQPSSDLATPGWRRV